jgi:hypothetical protein
MNGDEQLRALWRDQPVKEVPEMTIQALRERSHALAKKMSWRRWAETISGAISMALLTALAAHLRAAPLVQIACAMLVIGEGIVIANLWRRGRPGEAPLDGSTASHLAQLRADLAKERDLLASVARWYLAPTLPGLVFFPIAAALEIGVSAVVVGAWTIASLVIVEAIIVLVQRRAARRLTQEIDALGTG